MATLIKRENYHLGRLLRERVAQLRGQIEQELTHCGSEHFTDIAGSVTDAGDQAVADMLIDIENATVNRHALELRDAESALDRMAKGAYGRCVDCGDSIEYKRLVANPTATRCLVCQDRHERLYCRATRAL